MNADSVCGGVELQKMGIKRLVWCVYTNFQWTPETGLLQKKKNVVNIKSLASSLNEGMDAWDRDNENTKLIT